MAVIAAAMDVSKASTALRRSSLMHDVRSSAISGIKELVEIVRLCLQLLLVLFPLFHGGFT